MESELRWPAQLSFLAFFKKTKKNCATGILGAIDLSIGKCWSVSADFALASGKMMKIEQKKRKMSVFGHLWTIVDLFRTVAELRSALYGSFAKI